MQDESNERERTRERLKINHAIRNNRIEELNYISFLFLQIWIMHYISHIEKQFIIILEN